MKNQKKSGSKSKTKSMSLAKKSYDLLKEYSNKKQHDICSWCKDATKEVTAGGKKSKGPPICGDCLDGLLPDEMTVGECVETVKQLTASSLLWDIDKNAN